MNILICGATGFIGQALYSFLSHKKHNVSVLGRDPRKNKRSFPSANNCYTWDSFSLEQLKKMDAIINLSGASINCRWTKFNKQNLEDSRIQTTGALAQLCSQLGKKSPHLINAGGIGIYGMKKNFRDPYQGDSFLKNLAEKWESALTPALDKDALVSIIRLGPVLGTSGGILKELTPLFKKGLGAILGTGNQPFNWVYIDDVCKAVEWIIEKKIVGKLDIVAPHPCTNREFTKVFAKTLKKRAWLRIPEWLVNLIWGEMGKELFLNGQNVFPKTLLESGYTFSASTIEDVFEKSFRES